MKDIKAFHSYDPNSGYKKITLQQDVAKGGLIVQDVLHSHHKLTSINEAFSNDTVTLKRTLQFNHHILGSWQNNSQTSAAALPGLCICTEHSCSTNFSFNQLWWFLSAQRAQGYKMFPKYYKFFCIQIGGNSYNLSQKNSESLLQTVLL